MERFSWHVADKGFRMVRYYGFLSPVKRRLLEEVVYVITETVRKTAMCQRQDYWPFFAIFNVRYWSLMLSAFRHFIITDWRGVFCQHSRFAFFL